MKKLYNKYKEIINYLIAGVLTTIVSIGSYELFKNIFHIHYIISNVLSWIVAVTFAYFANRKYVFKSKSTGKSQLLEFFNFVKYRLLSLIIDTALMYLLVDVFSVNDDIAKVMVQVVVVSLNYIFSKYLTFKGNEKESDKHAK